MFKSNQKILFWLLLLLFFGISFFIASSFLIKSKIIKITPKVEEIQPVENEKITIILVGDIMLDRGVEYMVEKYGEGDFKFPFFKIADYLEEADIVFGNLEGPISDKGTKVGSIYSFRMNPKVLEGLTFASFDVLSLANNHAFDYTREAFEDCLIWLTKAGISYIGAGFNEIETYSPLIKEIEGTKIGFLAYTNLGPETWKAGENGSGIAWVNEEGLEKIKEDIKLAKEKADILIVSLHSGEEYQVEPTQFQIEFSKIAIEAGADLVVGHHSHIVQKNERYKNGRIFYSLGNFIFDQGFSKETMKSEILEVLIENDEIKKITPINIKINQYFQPKIEGYIYH